jgi:hypothetical protein
MLSFPVTMRIINGALDILDAAHRATPDAPPGPRSLDIAYLASVETVKKLGAEFGVKVIVDEDDRRIIIDEIQRARAQRNI